MCTPAHGGKGSADVVEARVGGLLRLSVLATSTQVVSDDLWTILVVFGAIENLFNFCSKFLEFKFKSIKGIEPSKSAF